MESPQTFGGRAFSAAARAYVLSSGKPEGKRGGQLSLSGMGTPVRAGRAPTPGVGGVRTHVVRERKHSQGIARTSACEARVGMALWFGVHEGYGYGAHRLPAGRTAAREGERVSCRSGSENV